MGPKVQTLVAKASPENVPSLRVLEKCDGKKSVFLPKAYERWVDRDKPGDEKKSDVWCWVFERPGGDS